MYDFGKYPKTNSKEDANMNENTTYNTVRDYSKPIVLKLEGEQGIKAMIEILTSPKTRYNAKAEAEKAKAELRKQGLEI